MTEEKKKKKLIEADNTFIVLAVPEDVVELEIAAKVYIGHEMINVYRKMDFPEVRAAIREAEVGYIPSTAVFTLAPTGEEKIRALVQKYMETYDAEDG